MHVLDLLTSRFWNRRKAMSCYRSGMSKANKQDRDGAITDYSAAIDMAEAMPDVAAMARYNRALMYFATERDAQGVDDLEAVLATEQARGTIKDAAKQKLLRMQARADKRDGESL